MNRAYRILAASAAALMLYACTPKKEAPIEPNPCVSLYNQLRETRNHEIDGSWIGTGGVLVFSYASDGGRGTDVSSIQDPASATNPQRRKCQSALDTVTNPCVRLYDHLQNSEEHSTGTEWITTGGDLYIVGGSAVGPIDNPALATDSQRRLCQGRLDAIINTVKQLP